jgi:carbon-monoxide dehydrogenase large subunit
VRVHPTGSVTVFTGSHSHGQGHETTFAQVVAARLGIPVENVDIVHGDTGRVPFGMGTYGSRSISVGGAAIMKALDKIEAKAKKIAAHLMEASDADIDFAAASSPSRAPTRRSPSARWPSRPTCRTTTRWTSSNRAERNRVLRPHQLHLPGRHLHLRGGGGPGHRRGARGPLHAVDDFGTIINPMIVEGQVHGGLVQGIGQALMENCVYDRETGQLLTGSYMDYAMPRADDFPSSSWAMCTPCTHNPLGTKGCGEAGAIGSPPAVINAVLDALRPLGVKDFDMPATPAPRVGSHSVAQSMKGDTLRACTHLHL